ncbi:MAG: MoaD/ThiS family protein [Oscillospiraceae bacterium]|nr:MoaD/ThiS family protein [Oscillospiraceae bacterium]
MVTVRLFGTFRLDCGIKSLELEAERVKDIYPIIMAEVRKRNPETRLKEADLKGCIITVNSVQVGVRTKLSDGDEVCLMPAVAGG